MLRVAEVALPSTPYMDLPSSSPSSSSARPHVVYASAFTSVHSSTAALIQADLFCASGRATGWASATNLFRFRLVSAMWLLAAAIWIPVCEYQGGQCAVGIARDPSLGEQGTLSGEGEPNPDPSIAPETPHVRTLWLLASLSYVMACALGLYFTYHMYLAYANRLLFKQCCSYDYSSLTIVTHASTSAHPLTWSHKLAGLLFQLVVPTTIGVCALYLVFILPDRRPLSWLISLHLHLAVGIFAGVELVWSKFLFRPKALVYWTFGAMAYILLLLGVQIRGHRWEYSSLNPDRSESIAIVAWICGLLFLGPGCFLACALVQYTRDGWTRGVFTSAVDIGEAHAQATSQLEQASILHSRGMYIQGALARFARDADDGAGGDPPDTPVQLQADRSPQPPRRNPSLNDSSSSSSASELSIEYSNQQGQSQSMFGSLASNSMGWLRSWWIAQP